MIHSWENQWRLCEEQPERRGGQGTVRKVAPKDGNGPTGALKLMHSDGPLTRERRFRMRQEASALAALAVGVPKLLDSNVLDAASDDSLFIVMEWIEGPTLGQRVSRARFSIDEALQCVQRLLRTLAAMHKLPMTHRDLKPDNVILREGKPEDPIIVDLGLAWAEVRPDADFRTEHGQEIGNRFLRLPEFAPGRTSQDMRSDLTLAAGLLLFMLAGRAPRILVDENGLAPHVALDGELTAETKADRRWVRLSRVFNRAFQTEVALRFQSADQMLSALENLEPSKEGDDPVSLALERLRAEQETDIWRKRHRLQKAIGQLGSKFDAHLRQLLQPSELSLPGGHGYIDAGKSYQGHIGLQIPGVSGAVIVFLHWLIAVDEKANEVRAGYSVLGNLPAGTFYCGPMLDVVSLEEAMFAHAPKIVAHALDTYAQTVRSQE